MTENQTNAPFDALGEILRKLPEGHHEQLYLICKGVFHEMRQNMGIIMASEALLRRSISADPDTQDDTTELLNAIQIAQQRIMVLITELSKSIETLSL